MSEAVELAKTARTSLAAALSALQSSDSLPESVFDLAEPIAKVMGILHRIERSGGQVLEGRDVALQEIRGLLSKLQHINIDHPVVDTVTEMVAGSLGKVHALTRIEAAPVAPTVPSAPSPIQASLATTAPLPQTSPIPRAAPQPAHTAPMPQPVPAQAPYQPPAAYAPAYTAPVPVPAASPVYQPAPQQAVPQAYAAPAQQPQYAQPYPQHPQQALPQQPQQVPPQAQPRSTPPPNAYVPPQPAQNNASLPLPPSAQAAPSAQKKSSKEPVSASAIEVALGIHSASNFYKGLGGNDVIEHGGIFVATYKIPRIGAEVDLRVMLPGDYEFSASAVVQWSRESGSGDSEPGFGARFTRISGEGRQLVYRYTRNREPIFYDDL